MAKKFATTLLLLLFAITQAQASSLPFSDVEEGTKYYDAILSLYEDGIITGYSDGTFKPDQEINRVEALKIILESAGTEIIAKTDETSEFTDISGTEWYINYITTGVENKIISGYADGTFKPEETVNLAEAMKMLVNTNELIPILPSDDQEFFADADKSAWYASYINYGAENGLIYADSNNNISPDKAMTRAELAYLIYRYENLGYYSGEVDYGKATYYADMFVGDHTANGDVFDQCFLTAAHKTLPFGTIVRVTNLANNQTVEVEINDRGPYVDGYVLDLSKSAFQMISTLGAGVINIEYEIVTPQQ